MYEPTTREDSTTSPGARTSMLRTPDTEVKSDTVSSVWSSVP